MDRLNKRVWIDPRPHWQSTLYVEGMMTVANLHLLTRLPIILCTRKLHSSHEVAKIARGGVGLPYQFGCPISPGNLPPCQLETNCILRCRSIEPLARVIRILLRKNRHLSTIALAPTTIKHCPKLCWYSAKILEKNKHFLSWSKFVQKENQIFYEKGDCPNRKLTSFDSISVHDGKM